VNEVIDQLDAYNNNNEADHHHYCDEELYDFKGLGQDPLEWLLENADEPCILPESSLPIFPDLNHQGDDDDDVVDDDDDDQGTATSMLEQSVVNEAVLNTIADPTVSVQSLFLPP
jgi:hypothetical protein